MHSSGEHVGVSTL